MNDPVFLQVYRDLARSGLLAELSGSELKVLLALGLEAHRLGGEAPAEAHFQRLRELGVVTGADRGRLFCYLDRDTLAARTGLSARTISTATNALAARDLVEKRSVRSHSGRHDYNVYFIQPGAHLVKFGVNRPAAAPRPEPELDRGQDLPPALDRAPSLPLELDPGQDLPPVVTVGKGPPAVHFPYVKNSSSSRGADPDPDAGIFPQLARRQRPAPNRSDLARTRAAGHPRDQIRSAVRRALDRRRPEAGPVWCFIYCLPIVRSGEPSAPQPQPSPLPAGPVAEPALPPSPQPRTRRGGPACPPAPLSAPAGLSPPSAGLQAAGDGVAGPLLGEEWQTGMERLYQVLREAGWPLDPTLQTALRAKALRVGEAARHWGADGPGWVGEAILLALGRKVAEDGQPAPPREQLLAYADGILNDWMQNGPPRRRRPVGPDPPSPPEAVSTAGQQLPALSPDPLLHRRPKSEEEKLWEQLLGDLRLQMTRGTFDQWLRGSELLELDRPEEGNAHLVVRVRSTYAVDWLEHRLKPVIQRTVQWRLGQEAGITFVAPDAAGPPAGDGESDS